MLDTEVGVSKKEQCRNIIDKAVSHAGKRVDSLEVTVTGSNIATSRFANNGMTQNQSPESQTVSVRAIVNGRQARLSSDRTAPNTIAELVDNTIKAAKLLEKDPDLIDLTSGNVSDAPANRFDQPTAEINPMQRADAIKKMIEIAKQSQLTAAGTYSSGEHYDAIGNSKGLFAFHQETSAEVSVTMRTQDSSGWAKEQSPRAHDVDAEALAKRAAQKAIAGKTPGQIQPGQYKVILEPSAVLDLLCWLWYDFSATSHEDKLSSLLNKLGQQVFDSKITITDDFKHPLQSGPPFDGEGMQRSVLSLVDHGVFKNMVFGRRSAQKLGAKPTGHALPQPSPMGEFAENLVVAGGDSSLEKMIAETDNGVLITRVWYVRVVDPATLLLTGLTQDGTFLIVNGKIKSGVKNMRFNVSIHELLNKVIALGPCVRAAGEEGMPAVVPPLLVADFNFTELSLF
jgi:predicted Zn-dependent protease